MTLQRRVPTIDIFRGSFFLRRPFLPHPRDWIGGGDSHSLHFEGLGERFKSVPVSQQKNPLGGDERGG